ncbi:MAG: 50S ribosomal protein L21 [Planctomycetaceae bacterium]|jgi:large subunit ribosomal protein L21|nr:50S ribosomal protein L21 [Planctomycetaceae bacterium]
MNYAIVKDGSRQLKVKVEQRVQLDYRGETVPGALIELSDVLAISSDADIRVGQPTIAGAKIVTEVLSDVKGPKLTIAKFRRRKNSKRKTGHRQKYTLVKVKEIIG